MKSVTNYHPDSQVEQLKILSQQSNRKISVLLQNAVDLYIERMIERGLLRDPKWDEEEEEEDEFAGVPDAVIEVD